MKTHEDIMVFVKPGARPTYNPQMTKGEAYSRAPAKRKRCNNHGYGFKGHKGVDNKGTRYPKSVLLMPRDFSAQQQVHPTQKPVKLMEWLIKSFSNEGDRVLDNCMGSCPVGIAANRLKRFFVGIEKTVKYFKLAKQRLTNACKGLDL